MNNHTIMFSVMLAFLSVLPLTVAGYEFLDDQRLSDHPLYSLPTFAAFTPKPVIMKRYARIESDKPDNKQMVFVPSVATFKKFGTTDLIFERLDVLTTPKSQQTVIEGRNFVSFELNRAARVFVLLEGKGINRRLLKQLTGSMAVAADVRGAPAGWNDSAIPVELHATSRDILPVDEDAPRSNRNFSFPRHSIALEVTLPSDFKLSLPNPRSISVNGHSATSFTILFAQAGPNTEPISALPSPVLPPPFNSHVPPGKQVDPSTAVPKPNAYCPEWVHDLYVTPTRASGTSLGELDYWRTWHPIVDPVYWCYFRHEHGSYPGWYYKPMFGYTAWKTPDNTTSHGRQEESHNGFKVFAFRLPSPETRAVILTSHMHLSKARRFSARHHTVILAVISPLDGALEAEMHLKFDFGAVIATLMVGGSVPIDEIQQKIAEEVKQIGRKASRRINVINIDSNYPASVDTTYKVRLSADPLRVPGLYEKWNGIFSNCVDNLGSSKAGLRFDIQDPATSIRFPGDYESMSSLKGKSMRRVVHFKKFVFSRELCKFNGISADKSIFYTNPYMTKLEEGTGPNAVRQYIKDGFVPLTFPDGQVVLQHFWNGPYTYNKAEKRSPINIDGAIDKTVN